MQNFMDEFLVFIHLGHLVRHNNLQLRWLWQFSADLDHLIKKLYGKVGVRHPLANFAAKSAERSAENASIRWQKSGFRHINCQIRQFLSSQTLRKNYDFTRQAQPGAILVGSTYGRRRPKGALSTAETLDGSLEPECQTGSGPGSMEGSSERRTDGQP